MSSRVWGIKGYLCHPGHGGDKRTRSPTTGKTEVDNK